MKKENLFKFFFSKTEKEKEEENKRIKIQKRLVKKKE
jgi:hypothetical protein